MLKLDETTIDLEVQKLQVQREQAFQRGHQISGAIALYLKLKQDIQEEQAAEQAAAEAEASTEEQEDAGSED